MKNLDICVVLVETKDDINIGNAVRACKNFGILDLRLVRPRHGDKERILISAPKAEDLIESIQVFPDLASALADRDLVIGLSARKRYGHHVAIEPREAAERSVSRRTAFIFGREDRGLTNAELDQCDALVTIPTNPDYSSLNLGQAVLLQAWEVFQVVQNVEGTVVSSHQEVIEKKRMEKLFSQIDKSLRAIGFYKYGDGTHILRGLRMFYNRATLNEREFAVFFGIFGEVEKQFLHLNQKNKKE